jgi:hypothetical protein
LQLLFRLIVARPDGDVKRRVEHLCRQCHVDVFSVAGDRRHEAGSSVDAGLPERFIFGGVGGQCRDAECVGPLDTFGVVVDEDYPRSGMEQFEHDAAADTAGAANDVMSSEPLEHASSPSSAEVVGELQAQQGVA